jgi:hypothetical protein
LRPIYRATSAVGARRRYQCLNIFLRAQFQVIESAGCYFEAVQDIAKAFQHNPDGSWSCVVAVTVDHPKGRMQVASGAIFFKGDNFMGVDFAAWLDRLLEPSTPAH